jgi:hypothetical protein
MKKFIPFLVTAGISFAVVYLYNWYKNNNPQSPLQ